MASQIQLGDIAVDVVLKDIKNVHLSVHPPTGRVRISAPKRMSIDMIRVFAVSKLDWIKRQQAKFAAQPRQSEREMVSGESHFVQGVRHRLDVIEGRGRSSVSLSSGRMLVLRVRPGTTRKDREAALNRWYRQLLRIQIPELISTWETIVGVKVADWRIRKMKTKWGSCSIAARRIWLNLELAKRPRACLEFIVVHEMVHLLERRHNDRFKEYLNQFMPGWRSHQAELNDAPLGAEDWAH